MVNTSTIPITIDGTRLDTFAWNIETLDGRLVFPGKRGDNAVIPGNDGVIYVPNKDYDAGIMTLKMWVKGSDVDGNISGGSSAMAEFRKNLDSLGRMFKRGSLMDVRQTWPAGVIQYLCSVEDTFNLAATAVNPKAEFAVVLSIPSTFGQDVSTTDQASATNLTSGTTTVFSSYAGGTAEIRDAILVVRGPATNPRMTDLDTGSWVQYNGTIATGTDWRINSGTWETVTGTGISYTSAGTSRVAETVYGGGISKFMSLSPRAAGPQVQLTGSGFGAATQILCRARRKFIL